uniref:Transporter, small conductance mechanosensitive ion channel (MscS) family protein n=3 Tax=Toxoplasma gondii TaxID=5811 RepID=A0A0F7V2U5_TOXGV|nr:TPA: transporter, small conductance mechanosensitive ion channel (MscS) family protein [Toxoplasma gondii VEG]
MERASPQASGDKGPSRRATKNEGSLPTYAADATKASSSRREPEEGVERHARLASFNLHASASAFRHLGSRLASVRMGEGSHAGALPGQPMEEEKEEPDSDAEDDDTPACVRACFKGLKSFFPDPDPFYWFALALIACLIVVLLGFGDGTSAEQEQYSLGVASPGWNPGDSAHATTKPPEIIEEVNMPTLLGRGGLAFFYVICINIALWLSFMFLRWVVILGVLNFVCYEMQSATAFTSTIDPDIFYVIWSIFCYILWLNNSERTNLVLVANKTAEVQPLMFLRFFGKDLSFPASSLQIIYLCNIVMIILTCRRLLRSLMIFVFELGFLMNMNGQAIAYLTRYSRLRKFNIKWCTFAAQPADTDSDYTYTSKFASRFGSMADSCAATDPDSPAQAPGPQRAAPVAPGANWPEHDGGRPGQRTVGEALDEDAFEKIRQLQEVAKKAPREHLPAARLGLQRSRESLREGKTFLRATTQCRDQRLRKLRLRHAAMEKRLQDEFGTANLPRQLHPKYIEKSKTSKIRNWLLIHYVYDYPPALFIRSERIELVHKPVAKQVADLLFKEIVRDQSELEAGKHPVVSHVPLAPPTGPENPNSDGADANFKDAADAQIGQSADMQALVSALPPAVAQTLTTGLGGVPAAPALGEVEADGEEPGPQSPSPSTGAPATPPPASPPSAGLEAPTPLEAKPAPAKVPGEPAAVREACASTTASAPTEESQEPAGDRKALRIPLLKSHSLTPPAPLLGGQREAPRFHPGAAPETRKLEPPARGASAAFSLLQAQDSEEFEPLEGNFDFHVLDKQTASLPEHLRTKHFETQTPFSISVSPDQADVAAHLNREAAARPPETHPQNQVQGDQDGDPSHTRLEVGAPPAVTERRPPFSSFGALFSSSPSHARAFEGDPSLAGPSATCVSVDSPRCVSESTASRVMKEDFAETRGSSRPSLAHADPTAGIAGRPLWAGETGRRARKIRKPAPASDSEGECRRIVWGRTSEAILSGSDAEAACSGDESSDTASKQEYKWLQEGPWRTRKSWAGTFGSIARFSQSEDSSEASRESDEEKKAAELLMRPYLFQERVRACERREPLADRSSEAEAAPGPGLLPRAPPRCMVRHRTVDLAEDSWDEDLAPGREGRRGDVELVPRERRSETDLNRQQTERKPSSRMAYRPSAFHGFELPALFGSGTVAAADPSEKAPQPGLEAPRTAQLDPPEDPQRAPNGGDAATASWAPEALPAWAPVPASPAAPANPGNFLSPNATMESDFMKPRGRANAVLCLTGLEFGPSEEEEEELAVKREYIDLFLKPEEADELMKDVDLSGHGKFNDAMFRRAVVILYSMRKKLLKSLKSQASIASTVSRMISVLLWVISFIILLLVLGVDINTVIVSGAACLSAIIVALSYFYQNFVTAVLFIAVSNPFNVGDRVRIDGGEILYVRKIRTYTSEFETVHGRPVFYSNAVLFNRVITNESRSKNSCFEIPLVLDIRTPESSIRQLQAAMQRYLESRSLEFVKDTFRLFVTSVQPGRQIDVSLWMTCVEGWGNVLKVLRTRTEVYFYLLKQLARLHISFQLPLQPIHFPSTSGASLQTAGSGNPAAGRLTPASPQERKVVSAAAATQQFQNATAHGQSLPAALAPHAWGDVCLQPEVSPFWSSPLVGEGSPGAECTRFGFLPSSAQLGGDEAVSSSGRRHFWERPGALASGVCASASCVGLQGDRGARCGETGRHEASPLDRGARLWNSGSVAAGTRKKLVEKRKCTTPAVSVSFREDRETDVAVGAYCGEEDSPPVPKQRVRVSGVLRARRGDTENMRRRGRRQERELRLSLKASESSDRGSCRDRERQALLFQGEQQGSATWVCTASRNRETEEKKSLGLSERRFSQLSSRD